MRISCLPNAAYKRTVLDEDGVYVDMCHFPRGTETDEFSIGIYAQSGGTGDVELHSVHDVDVLIKLLQETRDRMLREGV